MPTGSIKRPQWADNPEAVIDPMMLEAQGRRMRYAQLVAPDAVDDPGAIQGITALAQTAGTDASFMAQVDDLYGFNESGKMAADLAAAPDDLAYIQFNALPKSMQSAVRRQGFEPKEYGDDAPSGDGKKSGLFGSIPGIGGVAQAVSGFLGEEVLHPIAEGMNMLGRSTTQAYRASVDMSQGENFVSSMGSLFNPGDWQRSWSDVGNGATYMLDDDRQTVKDEYDLDNEDLDTYLKLSQGKLPGEIAEEEGLEVGTEEHNARVRYLYDQASSDVGRELVGDPLNGQDGMLNNYRVSFGRIWSRRAGFEPKHLDDGLGKVVSGSGDLAWALAADPTLLLGRVGSATRVGRIAIESMGDAQKVMHAAYASRMVEAGAWSKRASTGLRTVDLIDNATGVSQGTIALSRLAHGSRVSEAMGLFARALDKANPAQADDMAELLRTFPIVGRSIGALARESDNLVAAGRKGLDTVDGLEDFFLGSDGYRELMKFGGKNTSKHLQIPEIGRGTRARVAVKSGFEAWQDWSIGIDRKMAEKIGWAEPKLLNPKQVASATEELGEEAGKAVAQYQAPGPWAGNVSHLVRALSPIKREGKRLGLSANPLYTARRALPDVALGKFSSLFTTHVPRAGFVGIWSDDVTDFDRFLSIGKTLGMDSTKLDRYRLDFISQSVFDGSTDEVIRGAHGIAAANRSIVLKAYTDDLLSMFDVDPMSDLSRRFQQQVDQVYGINPDGTAKKGRALALSQTAEANAIPNMRDIVMSTNRYSVMRSMFGRGGVLNPRIVDATLTRYWKPGVLLRVGFIGRAAGEEMLAYLARYGSARYLGVTAATGVEKRRVYDQIMGELGEHPTTEMIRDLRDRAPEQWDDMLSWAQRSGPAPDAREVLSWGQSQMLAPFTGVIHVGDSFAQHVLLQPWQHDLALAPKWRLKAAERMRRADNFALSTSIRYKSVTRKIAPAVNPIIQRMPGLHAAADALDATLFPILSRLVTDMPTFKSVANQVGLPTAEQAARIFGQVSDEDWDALNQMLTDPFVRGAHLKQVVSGETMNVGHEIGIKAADELPFSVVEKDRFGNEVRRSLMPDSNKNVLTQRADGVTSGADHMQYDLNSVERMKHLLDPKTELGSIGVGVLSNHFPTGVVSRLNTTIKGVGVGLGETDDIGRVSQLVREVRNLPSHQRQALIDSVDAGTTQQVARDLAAQVAGDGIEENLQRGVLEVLAQSDPEIHRKLLNGRLDPDQITDDWNVVNDRLIKDFKRRYGEPGMQRLLHGWEGWHEGLRVPPRQGYLQGYGIAAPHQDAVWAGQNLTSTLNPDLKARFVADLRMRLEHRRLPDLADEIADEIFNPDYPVNTILQSYAIPEARAVGNSVPISMMASSNPELADEVAVTLSDLTGKHFSLHRLDIPETTLQTRPLTGTGASVLDGQDDWQRSILWRVQQDDWSGSIPLPNGSRKYMVLAPRNPTTTFPPFPPETLARLEGLVSEPTALPTTARWKWNGQTPEDGLKVEDILDRLPDPEVGKVRIYGTRPSLDPEAPIRWEAGEPSMALDPDSYAHHFADITEDEYTRLVTEGAFDEGRIELPDVDAHHFATEGEDIIGVDMDDEIIRGVRTAPEEFEYTMLSEEGWHEGYTPVHFVEEHESPLRELANLGRDPLYGYAESDPIWAVAERLGITREALLADNPAGQLARKLTAQRADTLLVEGRRARALSDQDWWDEEKLKEIADGMGVWDENRLHNVYKDAYQATLGPPPVPSDGPNPFGFNDRELNVLRGFGTASDHGFTATLTQAGVPHNAPLVDELGTPTDTFYEFMDDIEEKLEENLDYWRNFSEQPGGSELEEQIGEAMNDLLEVRSAITKMQHTVPEGIDPEKVNWYRERIADAKRVGMSETDPMRASYDENEEIRQIVAPILDELTPGWRGSEGWDRVGTGKLFGIESWEPTSIEGSARKHFVVGNTPAQKENTLIEDEVENFVRHFTNARSGAEGAAESPRALDEYLFPLSHNASPNQVDLAFVQRAKMDDRPLDTFGKKYVTAKSYGWDRLTNWFFDDVAAEGIASIVRNQLFATNYIEASRLTKGLSDTMLDPALRQRVLKTVKAKWGMDEEQFDEYIRMHHNGMIEMPYVSGELWDDFYTYTDEGEALKVGSPEYARHEAQRDAVTAVQNGTLRAPGPEMSVSQANRMMRADLGLKDTPLAQAIRDKFQPVIEDIVAEQRKVAQALEREGLGRVEIEEAVSAWRKEMKPVHDLRFKAAADEAKTEVNKARAMPTQLQTDPRRLEGYRDAKGAVLPAPEVGEIQQLDDQALFARLGDGGEQKARDLAKERYGRSWESLEDAQRRNLLGDLRHEIPPMRDDIPWVPNDAAWGDEMVADLSGPEITELRMYLNQASNAHTTVRDATIQRALEGVIPFIDDHRIRSQFQEYVGNMIPFWFAEEQFLKRWTRIVKESPDAFRKGQLAMHGLRVIGAVHTDPITGQEYYVYPGSSAATSLFTETPLAKMLFGKEASMPVGLALTGDVQHTLPGFGDQMGTPSAGPFVGMAMEFLGSRSPEFAQLQTAVMGEVGSNKQMLSFLVPSTVTRFYTAFTKDLDERQLASALIETAQLMEASGNGLDPEATADEQQDYIDRVEANARSVMLLRGAMGFVSLSSPGIDNSSELPLSNEFQSLIQSGIPYSEALQMFMEKHKGDVSPYTVFRTEVPSSAPQAATQESLEAMKEYEAQLEMFPMAGPWMLLPFRASEDEFSNKAYRQQIRMGLREYRSHDEYIAALAWADASPQYFEAVEEYDALIEAARAMEDQERANALTTQKLYFTDGYKNTHPVFADKLMSSEGRVQRQQILRESYMLMDHPDVQGNKRIAPMREMLTRYQGYSDAMEGLNDSRAKNVVAYKNQVTMEFQGWLGLYLMDHPDLRYFYDRVLRPELSWARSTLDESMVA